MIIHDETVPRRILEGLLSVICDSATGLQLDASFAAEIGPLVNQDDFAAKSAEQVLSEAYSPDRRELLDFGCGAMAHRPFIESLGYRWRGVEYWDALAQVARDRIAGEDAGPTFYDGRILPFEAGAFDVVWAMLSMQHVQHVDASFNEIARVLKPGGAVIGQVSYLEQMQYFSTFNFTPYGLKVASERNGLRLARLYPKHDVFSFLARRLLITLGSSDQTPFDGMMDPDGVFHAKIIDAGTRLGLDTVQINLLRLMFCAHFVFELRKP